MTKRKFIAVVLALSAAGPFLPGASGAGLSGETGSPAGRSTIVVLPILFYTPETKLAGGVGGLLAFRPSANPDGGRPTAVNFYALYTQRKQFMARLEPEIYLDREKYLIKGKFGFERYPDKFWGFGDSAPSTNEEDYTPRMLSAEASFLKKIAPRASLYAGLQVIFQSFKIVSSDPGGRVATGSVPGATGGTVAGLGFVLNRDNRDDIFFPHRGDYWHLAAIFNGKALGGDFAYTSLKLDLRKFFPVSPSGVLAVQALLKAVGGNAPFYNYPKLGGDSMMRGYYSGRYTDKLLAAVQAEFRMALSARFGAVGFAGLGNVAPRPGAFDFGTLKPSLGAGLRFRVSRRETANLRLDFAWGKGSSGFYITANEAF